MPTVDVTDTAVARRRLASELMASVDRPDMNKPYGLYFVAGDSAWAPLARFVEQSVFLRWFGNDNAEMDTEYGPYEQSSMFALVVDHEACEPVGAVRFIEEHDAGLKTLNDIRETPNWGVGSDEFLRQHFPGYQTSDVLDVATIAVRDGWGSSKSGGLVSAALYGSIFRIVVATGAVGMIAALDEPVAELLRVIGLPIEPICNLPAIRYLGSDATRPYIIRLAVMREAITNNPTVASIANGTMIDNDFSVPPLDLDRPGVHPTKFEPRTAPAHTVPTVD